MSERRRPIVALVATALVLATACRASGRQERTGSAATSSGGASPGAAALAGEPDPCGWRRCDFESGLLACAGEHEICDMSRNLCVRACRGGDCCADVSCPSGTACAPAVGLCGAPAGADCFDLGTTWWTGRDFAPERLDPEAEPSPVSFELTNDSETPLYFEATVGQPVRFDLYGQACGSERRLEIPENHFCPEPCPDAGPVRELDCRRPTPVATRLPPAGTVIVSWSGVEEVEMRRVCGRPDPGWCDVRRATVPGTYAVEVCAHTEAHGGRPVEGDPDSLLGATVAGERRCRRLEFTHPSTGPVAIGFGP